MMGYCYLNNLLKSRPTQRALLPVTDCKRLFQNQLYLLNVRSKADQCTQCILLENIIRKAMLLNFRNIQKLMEVIDF